MTYISVPKFQSLYNIAPDGRGKKADGRKY